jgi:hypothetical protein
LPITSKEQGVPSSYIDRKAAFGAKGSWKRGVAGLMALVAVTLFAGPANAVTEDIREVIACRVAIEEVLWNHRIWPAENDGPKPAFDRTASAVALGPRVEDALRQSNALAALYGQPVTGEMLQAELDRMAKESRQPEVARDIFAALGDDPAQLAPRILSDWRST